MADTPKACQLVPVRGRANWREAFLAALVESSNVKASAAKAGTFAPWSGPPAPTSCSATPTT